MNYKELLQQIDDMASVVTDATKSLAILYAKKYLAEQKPAGNINSLWYNLAEVKPKLGYTTVVYKECNPHDDVFITRSTLY